VLHCYPPLQEALSAAGAQPAGAADWKEWPAPSVLAGCQAADDSAHVDLSAEWAQPQHVVRCGLGETVPLAVAVPSLLLGVLWRAKGILPRLEWDHICDKLERFWAATAAQAAAAAEAQDARPKWQAPCLRCGPRGTETRCKLLVKSLAAFGSVLRALEACMPEARRLCQQPDAGMVRTAGCQAVVQCTA
jgi:hypothetical protein